jgi:3-phosphoshikimate 1-carboxyvinyltransferase
MTACRISPGRLEGRILAPPSKSYTHRALVAAHLAGRRALIVRALDSDDTHATIRAIHALGSRVHRGAGRWSVAPGHRTVPHIPVIDCGESGTTLRLGCALAARSAGPVRLDGGGRLPSRPISELTDALSALGARCRFPRAPRSLPLVVEGPLRGGSVTLDASRSSQFATALLLVLPTLERGSELTLTGELVSEPYIDATLAVLRHHGVRYSRTGRRFTLPGGQSYSGRTLRIPGDASSAAYLWAGAAVTRGRVAVGELPGRWPQADLAVLDLLRDAGATVRRTAEGAVVQGPVGTPFERDLTSAPDLYPLAAAIAAVIPGTSRLSGAGHVVLKESDRRAGARRLASALGARVSLSRGRMTIRGTAQPRRFRLWGLKDHRLVMSAAIGALAAGGPSELSDAGAVEKSYPGFWHDLAALREGPR